MAMLAGSYGAPSNTGRMARHSAANALIAGVFGTLATGFGAGLGIRHLQKTGVAIESLLGLVVLVAGLALLGFAIVTAWRALRSWWRLILLPAGALCLAVAMSLALAVMFTFVPRTQLGSTTPADRGLAYSDVTFPATDGITLSAWMIPSTNHAAIILLNGAGSNRTATLAQAVVLARHGYGVLMVDARGQGRSSGRGMDIGWYGDQDTGGAVVFLQHRSDVDQTRIAILGLSMGGEEAVGAAAAADRAVRAVIAEGATQRTAVDKSGWLPGGFAGTIQRGLDRLTYGMTALLTPARQPIPLHDAIAKSGGTSFLLIAAGREPDETKAANYFRSAAPDRVSVWTAPGANHAGALDTDPQQWESHVITFLDRALGVR
jgi:pimeloyl-ACP methyl ester carboxylesterase